MNHTGLVCTICNTLVYSRANHDLRHCDCGSCYIDGGFEYVRTGGEAGKTVSLVIDKSQRALYNDWNKFRDKLGKHQMIKCPKWIVVSEIIPKNDKTLTPKQCAEQFRMYAKSHPSKDSKHSLVFCADFLDKYCKEQV